MNADEENWWETVISQCLPHQLELTAAGYQEPEQDASERTQGVVICGIFLIASLRQKGCLMSKTIKRYEQFWTCLPDRHDDSTYSCLDGNIFVDVFALHMESYRLILH